MFRSSVQTVSRIAPKTTINAPARNPLVNSARSITTCRPVEVKTNNRSTTNSSRSSFNNSSRFLSTQSVQIPASNSTSNKRSWLYGAVAGATALALLAAKSEESQAGGAPAAPVDYNAVRQSIIKLLDQDDNRGPLFVRLAWHASGTYDKNAKNGGSNGSTMRYQPEAGFGANYGLEVARELLEAVKKDFPGISYADLWTLSAAVAIEYMGGPAIPWRSGRSDAPSRTACPPDGRLPDADKGSQDATSQHLRDIFYRMGFDDQEIVALAGAHALGRCHQDRSGYHGPWTRAPTTFSNQYFKELLETKWSPKKWDGPLQYEDPSGELMMLPADLAFVQDAKFKPFVEKYAADEQLFFKDFAKAFQKLEELGCNFDKPSAAPAPEQKPAKKGWW